MAPAAEASTARLRMMCSHGGCFAPRGPGGAVRYVGGETRVLVVPRGVSFRDLATRLGEMAGGGKIVSSLKHRLIDDDDVLVSFTCDEELAHLRDEYDRLHATRPSAIFRVFFSGVQRSGRPPLPPGMRRVQSEPCTACPAPPPMRRVQSAQDLARCSRFQQPCCYDGHCHRRPDNHAPVPAPPMRPPLSTSSKNAPGARAAGQEPAPVATMPRNSHGAIRQGQGLISAKATTAMTGTLSGCWTVIRV